MELYTLLVVARTQFLAKSLRSAFDADQYLIRWVPSTSQALKLDFQPSLLILVLPPSGGARNVTRLKHWFGCPVLALVQADQPVPTQVDVWLTSPYREKDLAELVENTLISHSPHMIRATGISLDTGTGRLQIDGTVHQLRPIGRQILAVLMAQAGRVVPRDELFRQVWLSLDGYDTRALDVHIAYLRRELEADPHHPRLILTERGVGYRLQPRA